MGSKTEGLTYSSDNRSETNAAHGFLFYIDSLNKVVTNLCGLAMLVMVACVGLGILNRFVFSYFPFSLSMPWTEEVTRYLMTWVVFLGAAVAARKDKLIGLQVLIHALPRRLGSSLKYLTVLISQAFYLTLVWVGLEWVEMGQSQDSPVLKLPMVVVYSAMSVGFALSILNTFALLYEAHKSKGGILEAREGDSSSAVVREEKKE